MNILIIDNRVCCENVSIHVEEIIRLLSPEGVYDSDLWIVQKGYKEYTLMNGSDEFHFMQIQKSDDMDWKAWLNRATEMMDDYLSNNNIDCIFIHLGLGKRDSTNYAGYSSVELAQNLGLDPKNTFFYATAYVNKAQFKDDVEGRPYGILQCETVNDLAESIRKQTGIRKGC